MTFLDKKHLEKIKKMEKLWKSIEELSSFAKDEYDIDDIFQDNNGKVLQQLVYMNFENIEGREGNDGCDCNGVEWEMKSVNLNKTSSISTHHHLNKDILSKYRVVPWSFSLYRDTTLEEIYVLSPEQLEEQYFSNWEDKIETRQSENKSPDLNNPKIQVRFVKEHGKKVFPISKNSSIPTEVYDSTLKRKNLKKFNNK